MAADDDASRQRWSSSFSFVLASVGSAIGFGNIWRFPKLLYQYGGGAFLIPYGCALFFCTIPVVVLEFALGQRFQSGHVRMMSLAANNAPSVGWAAGFGWAAVIGTFLLAQFYIALLATTLCYLIGSFAPVLPWTGGPAHDFFLFVVQPSPSVATSGSGSLVPHLAVAYAVVWVIVTLSAAKSSASIELLNKIVMPVPFLVLLIFLVRGLTLPGAADGVASLFTPDLSALASVEIWIVAISQLFFGVSAGLGTLTTYASFNPRDTPVVRSAILVCLGNSAFSLLAGITVFAFLGHVAHERGCDLADVAEGGSSLAFEIFPVAFAALPWPHFWAVAFFLMLLNLGVSSAVSMTAPLATALTEALQAAKTAAPPGLAPAGGGAAASSDLRLRRDRATAGWRARLIACCPDVMPTLLIHAFGFVSGLTYVTHAGSHWVDLGDHFVPLYLTVITGLCECLLVSFVHGSQALLDELPAADRACGWWWKLCWQIIIPLTLTVLLIAQVVNELTSPFGTPPSPVNATADGGNGTVAACVIDLAGVANVSSGGGGSGGGGGGSGGNSSSGSWREWTLPGLNSSVGGTEGPYGVEAAEGPYPPWATAIGWLLAIGPTMLAPCCALHAARARRSKSARMPQEVVGKGVCALGGESNTVEMSGFA